MPWQSLNQSTVKDINKRNQQQMIQKMMVNKIKSQAGKITREIRDRSFFYQKLGFFGMIKESGSAKYNQMQITKQGNRNNASKIYANQGRRSNNPTDELYY
jgi:hypothetical protein